MVVALLWAAGTLAFEHFGEGLSPLPLNRFRTRLAALLLGLAWLAAPAGGWPHGGGAWLALLLSGLLQFGVSDTLFFITMRSLGAQATATSQTTVPALVALLAWIGLGEKLGPGQILGLVLTVASVATVVLQQASRTVTGGQDAAATSAGGVTSAALTALSQALAVVIARFGLVGVAPLPATLLRVAPAALVLSWVAPPLGGANREGGVPPSRLAGLAGAVLVGSALATLLQTFALQRAPTGVVSVLGATYPLWMMLMAHVIGRTVERRALLPTAGAVVGVGLVLTLAG